MRWRSAGEPDRTAERRLLTAGAPERNSTSPKAEAVAEEAVAAPVVAVALAAGLVAVAAGPVAVAAGRVAVGARAVGVVGGRELGPAALEMGVRDRQVPGQAPAAAGPQPEPALLRGRPALVAEPGLPEEERPADRLEPLGRRELEVPG